MCCLANTGSVCLYIMILSVVLTNRVGNYIASDITKIKYAGNKVYKLISELLNVCAMYCVIH